MTSPAELGTSEQYMAIAERWFTEGLAGNLAMAGGIFSQELRDQRRPCRRGRAGRQDPRTAHGVPRCDHEHRGHVVSDDKIAVSLIWRGTHTGPYGGVAATGKPVEARDTAIRRCEP